MNLDVPLFQMSARQYFEVERSIYGGTVLSQMVVMTFVGWLFMRARRWWRARADRRANLGWKTDREVGRSDDGRPLEPCPACGHPIDADDASLFRGGLYVARDSALGSAVELGRPNWGLAVHGAHPDIGFDRALSLLFRWRASQGWKVPQTAVEQEADRLLGESGRLPADLTPPKSPSPGDAEQF